PTIIQCLAIKIPMRRGLGATWKNLHQYICLALGFPQSNGNPLHSRTQSWRAIPNPAGHPSKLNPVLNWKHLLLQPFPLLLTELQEAPPFSAHTLVSLLSAIL